MKTRGTNKKRRVANPRANQNVFISHNFSDIEDNKKAFEIIRNIATHAGNNAAAEAKAAGLPRVYIRNRKDLIRISAAGQVKIIRPKNKRPSYYIKYKPNTVLHALSS